ncbi:MAG: alpha-2-macroglobulin [Dysgonamonadaceae bacterium]|jgi:uncharacterized protein YfaS (alpha-2-macroglobulin family)|nr:alpha-2-macroglobulin [Dysgonamonadaceae bacterium]
MMKLSLLKFPFIAAVMLATAVACNSPAPLMNVEEASQWITSYTPGRISPNSVIRIEFTDSAKLLIDTAKTLKDVIRFSPSLKGKVSWRAEDGFLQFEPKEGLLKPGKQYDCQLKMSKILGNDKAKDFVFSFFVAERHSQIKIQDVRIDPKNVQYIIVGGEILFSESVEKEAVVNGLLSCVSVNCKPETLILPTGEKNKYTFTLSGLNRMKDDKKIEIRFNAEAIGFGKMQKLKINIPGLEEFKVLSAKKIDAATPHIDLEFSTPLDEKQDLEGLISLNGLNNISIQRNGNTGIRVVYDYVSTPYIELYISDLIRSADGRTLSAEIEKRFKNEVIPPAIEIPLSGAILPDATNLTLPFRAVNLAAVDVKVVKVYAGNVLMFLQDNDLEGSDHMRRSGRLIFSRTVRLDKDPDLNLRKWQNFSIDLAGLFKQERGAIYNIRLSFKQDYSLYGYAGDSRTMDIPVNKGISDEENARWDKPDTHIWYGDDYQDWDRYNWKEEDDPSKPTYYMNSSRMPEYNLVASNLGLIVKSAKGGQLWTAVSDIITTRPLANVKVTAYNFQLKEIGQGLTNMEGFADFVVSGKPFVVTATLGQAISYLKVTDNKELSTSLFDVGGKTVSNGLKAYIYGERGVWRPGDTAYLTFIVEDKQRTLPANHPVTMEVYTPQGQFYDRQTVTDNKNGFYSFEIKTDDNAPTGTWKARFRIGNQLFHKEVRIESIKPNRLKIHIDMPEILQAGKNTNIEVESHWLTGPVAAGLKTELEMVLYNNSHPFEAYRDYSFSNPLTSFSASTLQLGSAVLDSCGRLSLKFPMPATANTPGMLQANINCRVMEAGGDASIVSRSMRYSPYNAYVGVKLNEAAFETDRDLVFPVVSLNTEGKLLSGRKLEYKIYKLNWSWWWDGSAKDLRHYVQSTSEKEIAEGKLQTQNGRTDIPFRVNYPSWGKYLVFVRDTESDHATGGVVYVDWPSWRGHSGKLDPAAASMLSFTLNKKSYHVGDMATVYLPAAKGGRALLSIENGSRVISREWLSTSDKTETAHKFSVTKDMAPNFYVHATLLQPHRQTANDLPIRMYGVQPVQVIDKASLLHPLITASDVIRPQQVFTVKVRERNNKPMTYTLAIVDEGLLDITSFRTPNPWPAMNEREALGVKTWDLYDNVTDACNGKFSTILSIGGDEALRSAAGKEKRFNPVVKFLGPFTLTGGSRSHRIMLPMYTGSVRVMVVAGGNGTFGSADKTVTVRSPLMVLPALPRILSCGDRVSFPVNVFAMEEGIRDVAVNVKVEGPVRISGATSQQISFGSPSEELANFMLECDATRQGQAKVTVTAICGKNKASETIYIEVRNPNPPVLIAQSKMLHGGDTCKFEWKPFESGEAKLEISAFPSIDFGGTFAFITDYAHFCTEQLSARALNLLYARRFLDARKQLLAEQMLPELLKAIQSRQLSSGGFAYWPGNENANEWATSMAGQVLTEARKQGFPVPLQIVDKWLGYQKKRTQEYRHQTASDNDLQQAYRLYTLAFAGETNSGAMNKLRESKTLSEQVCLRLAAAYSISGRTDVANQLLSNRTSSGKMQGSYNTFWSPLRDKAMALETWTLAGQTEQALALATEVAREFSIENCSTQEVAFVSVAMNRLADVLGDTVENIRFSQSGDNFKTIMDAQDVSSYELNAAKGKLLVENRSSGNVNLSVMLKHRNLPSEKILAVAENVTLSVRYTNLKGDSIAIEKLCQGDEFVAHILIDKKTGSTLSNSMALTFAVPSGWEIWNDRLYTKPEAENCIYKDIRDERMSWYFSLSGGERKRFSIRLCAAYAGKFLLPPAVCEDMYNSHCHANTSNGVVEVIKK